MPDLTADEVRERFDWALRQGNPKWLWPGVPIPEWQDALQQLARVIGEVLQQGRSKSSLDCNPAALGVACYTSGTGPLLGSWLEAGLIAADPEVSELLAVHLGHNRGRMKVLLGQAVEVVEALAAAGIAATIVKGMHTAYAYFPEPACRPMSDIDVVIAAGDERGAGQVLERLGFEPGLTAPFPPQRAWHKAGLRREPRSLCFVHADDPWAVDIQTSLNRRYSSGAPIVRLDDAWRGHGRPWGPSPLARTLPQPLLTMQLAAHAGSGLFSLTLLRLVELVLVIRKDVPAGTLDWHEFLAEAARAGALGSVWPALHMTEQLAPGTVPPEVREVCEQHAPRAVRRVIRGLHPATAHRVARCSVEEHFMWSGAPAGFVRQVVSDLSVRNTRSPGVLWRVYWQRACRLANGTLTWR